MATIYGEPRTGDAFNDRRRSGVGGSDAGAILGVSSFMSRLGVWEQKRGLRPPSVATERMLWGNRLQDAILAGYGQDHGLEVERGRFHRHAGVPFVIGHPDGYATDERGNRRLVEVKTASHLTEQWGEPGSEDVPPAYYAQVQHYLFLRSLAVADLTALVGGRELRTYTIRFDPEFTDALLDEEHAFWLLVKQGEPPEPDGSEDAGRALRRMFPVAVDDEAVATPEVAGYADRYLAAKDAVAAAELDRDRWAQAIQKFMGQRGRLVGPGFSGTWSNRQGQTSWKAVAAEALTVLQLIASIDGAASLGTALEAAREAVEGWDETVRRNRGESSRVFSLTRKAAAS